MTSRKFTVETRGQAVIIFGGPSSLTSLIIKELLLKNIFAAKIETLEELENIKNSYDPDYLVVFEGGVSEKLCPTLQSLINSGESRLIVAQNLGTKEIKTPLNPVAKTIWFSDYVGENEILSSLLQGWINTIETTHSITVPNDGLGELSILGINDLARLMAKSMLYPSTKVGDEIILGNPSPISPLNLAYLVRTSIPFKVELKFDSHNLVNLWEFNASILEASLATLNYQLEAVPEQIIKKFLNSHVVDLLPVLPTKEIPIETLIEPVKAPEQELPSTKKFFEPMPKPNDIVDPLPEEPQPQPKKLTPLKTYQPMFIPLQTKKPKLQLSLKMPSLRKHNYRLERSTGPVRVGTIIKRGLIIALALYLGTLAFSATIAGLSLKNTLGVLSAGEIPSSNNFNKFSVTYLQANWIVFTSIPGLGKNQSISEINLLLDAYNQALSTFATAESLGKSMGDLTGYIFGSSSIDAAQVISQGRLQAEDLYQKLSLLDGSLPAETPKVIEKKYKSQYQEAKAKLSVLKRGVTTTKALLATAPDVIGLGGRHKYAILFQNNLELRATGGFIGSFAVITLENGKLYDMPIFDVYEVDGQLKGHVDPPKAIKDILGEANWYLRDSNFDPDFPTSARRAEWFIKKSMNIDLDGTFAVNINTLSSLLKATGPLLIPDYNETVTDANLAERSQFHAEGNFFPGSAQKKEFLSTVASAIFAKLPSMTAGEGLKLVTELGNSVSSKNTLLSFTSAQTDRVFQTLGWNGILSDFPCPTSSSCHKDYAMVVDSNFGVNKANYFIKRSIEEVITFDKNLSVNHTMRLNYQNTSPSTAWPAGIYKNYQRLYLPIGTTISTVKINGRQLEAKDYSISSEHNKFVLAYLVSVAVGEKSLVEIEYSTPQLPQEKELLYTWYWQKQPGTSGEDPVTVYLNYPSYLRPMVISPQSEVNAGQLKFDLKNDTDRRITVKFSK